MTVAVVKHDEIGVILRDEDLQVEFYSGTGAGGQHRNKKQNSVRMTHLPSHTVVTASSRSKKANLEEARTELTRRLTETQRALAKRNTNDTRTDQIGSGMRGDKMRTYRFRDDRVEDHRTGRSARCSRVMAGHFDLLW